MIHIYMTAAPLNIQKCTKTHKTLIYIKWEITDILPKDTQIYFECRKQQQQESAGEKNKEQKKKVKRP